MSDKFGTVAQVIGPVVDVTFEGEDNLVPPIYRLCVYPRMMAPTSSWKSSNTSARTP